MDQHSPDFVFLSEPMLFQCDQLLAMNLFKGEYSSALSSDDIFDPELPLVKNRAKGPVCFLSYQYFFKLSPNCFLFP